MTRASPEVDTPSRGAPGPQDLGRDAHGASGLPPSAAAAHAGHVLRRVFVALLVTVTLAKLAIVFSGADYDGDAYAHAMAGRRLLLDPSDVTVHWVWLPLLHLLYSFATLAGSGLTAMRVANALISSASALVLVAILRARLSPTTPSAPSADSHSPSPDSARAPVDTAPAPVDSAPAPVDSASAWRAHRSLLPWFAGALLLLDPLGLWLGVTGQTEPLFQLTILLGCLFHDRRSPLLAALSFAAAALTRYEAWPLIAVLFWLSVRPTGRLFATPGGGESTPGGGESTPGGSASILGDSPSRGQELPPLAVLGASRLRAAVPPASVPLRGPRGGPLDGSPRSLRGHALWLFPSIAVAAWCLFHYKATGEPLQFLRFNREFVEGYLAGIGYPWGKQPILPLMAVFYLTVIPVWNMLGPVHVLTLVGIRRAIRGLPRPFVLVQTALLGIVTFGFVRRTHLGLPRHAVAFAPLYCALVATGTLAFADTLSQRLRRSAPKPRIAAISVLALVLLSRTVPKAIELLSVTRGAFREQAIAARALREAALPGEPIACEDGKIEILSALAPDRFLRWQLPDISAVQVANLTRQRGTALVIGAPSRTAHLTGGQVVWHDDELAITRFSSEGR